MISAIYRFFSLSVQSEGKISCFPTALFSKKKYIDFTVTTDERICDGFYFASSIKFMKRCLANPERLDEKPESVVRDVD